MLKIFLETKVSVILRWSTNRNNQALFQDSDARYMRTVLLWAVMQQDSWIIDPWRWNRQFLSKRP